MIYDTPSDNLVLAYTDTNKSNININFTDYVGLFAKSIKLSGGTSIQNTNTIISTDNLYNILYTVSLLNNTSICVDLTVNIFNNDNGDSGCIKGIVKIKKYNDIINFITNC
jgi:hypothetical protein